MEMDMRRLTLRAALLKLFEGRATDESVHICCENMASLFAEVDDIRHVKRRGGGTDWSKEALERVSLERVGNFTVRVKTKKDRRVVTFTDDEGVSVEFIFGHTPRKSVDRLGSAIERAKGESGSGQKAVADAFMRSVVEEALSGRSISHEERLLGDKPLALDEYRLERVDRAEPFGGFLKFLPFKRRAALYVETP